MRRDLSALAGREFDLVVVGGGVNGLCIAWDAAQRGLRAALLEKSDFGHATSAASFKIVHGGLRYLQHLDFLRMRISIRERMLMMRMAPHLVHPLPFVLPCYGHGLKGPEVMFAGMIVNDTIGADRNRLADEGKRIPRGRVLSRSKCLEMLPGIPSSRLSGAALFYDAQLYNSERLALLFALAADQEGASLANYAEVTGFLGEPNDIRGVRARDCLTGDVFEVPSRLVVNAAGPWSDILLQARHTPHPERKVKRVKGIQIFTRSLSEGFAFAMESRQADPTALISRGNRLLFATPWHGKTFIGTTDEIYEGDPDEFAITESDIARFLEEINEAHPPARLEPADVLFWCGGLRPIDDVGVDPRLAGVARRNEIVDHERTDGTRGLISAIGVKYTTCRYVAEKTVDLAEERLGRRVPCRTHTTRLPGGDIEAFDDFLQDASRQPVLDEATTRHLVYSYGTEWKSIQRYVGEEADLGRHITGSREVIRAEVLHAVRHEMAVKLADAVLRRTDLGTLGHPGQEALADCARVMAIELGWDSETEAAEIQATDRLFRLPAFTNR